MPSGGQNRLTQDAVIARFKGIHGKKYDYSKVEYKGIKSKVCIICPEHGEFWQTPASHFRGHGCTKCVGLSKYTTREFIIKAKKVHKDKYDYSKVEYKNSHTEICIICPIHGEFWQSPSYHLSKRGCPYCSGRLRLTTPEFIRRAREVHGDKYDYSQTEYTNIHQKISIRCFKHGIFSQKACNHLRGQGCPHCANRAPVTTLDFINKARMVHGDKYDYSKSEYVGCDKVLCIKCPTHGEFWQIPNSHLSGCGCPKCANKNITTNDFIEKAKEIHGDKYSYTQVEYNGAYNEIPIICPKHGTFWQTPNSHLSGHGCPICKESHGERSIRVWLDENSIPYIREFYVKPTQVLFGRNKFLVDFYLPDHNTFIEFHGAQHYIQQSNWQTEEQFAIQQNRDRRLREYCKSKGIKLIEIPYTEIDNIDKILSKKIKV